MIAAGAALPNAAVEAADAMAGDEPRCGSVPRSAESRGWWGGRDVVILQRASAADEKAKEKPVGEFERTNSIAGRCLGQEKGGGM